MQGSVRYEAYGANWNESQALGQSNKLQAVLDSLNPTGQGQH